jgi:hypothetical protein
MLVTLTYGVVKSRQTVVTIESIADGRPEFRKILNNTAKVADYGMLYLACTRMMKSSTSSWVTVAIGIPILAIIYAIIPLCYSYIALLRLWSITILALLAP